MKKIFIGFIAALILCQSIAAFPQPTPGPSGIPRNFSGITSKSTVVNNDIFPIDDSAANYTLKKISAQVLATYLTGSFVSLQATTPGAAQTGHGNITGTFIAGGFSGPLTGNASSATLWGAYATITGPTQARVYAFPDAAATILTTNTAVTAPQGGTGQTVYAVGDLLYAPTTTTIGPIAAVAAGQVLASAGVNTVPAYTATPTLGGLTIGSTTAGGNIAINATLGSELAPALTTGNWTLGTGWQYLLTPDRLDKNADGTGTATPAAATNIVAGTTYKAIITVDSISGSTATCTLGGVTIKPLLTNTTYTTYITASTTGKLIITPVATGLRITISAVSIMALTDATGDLGVFGNLKVYSPMQDPSGNDCISLLNNTVNIGPQSTYTGSARLFINNPSGTNLTGLNVISADASNWAVDINPTGAYGGFIVRAHARSNFGGGLSIGSASQLPPNAGLYVAGNVGIGTATFGTSAAGVLGMAAATAPTTAVAGMATLWPIALNGAGTTGFRFMNEAATTVYTMMGCSGTTVVSTGLGTILMASATVGPTANAGWLTTINNLGVVVYVPYWTSPSP